MKVKYLFIFAVLTALLSSCASEAGYSLRIYDVSDYCPQGIIEDEDFGRGYVSSVDSSLGRLDTVSLTPVYISILYTGREISVETKHITSVCSYEIKPIVEIEDSIITVEYVIGPSNSDGWVSYCICYYNVSFKCNGINPGNYFLTCYSRWEDNSESYLVNEPLELYEGEAFMQTIYMNGINRFFPTEEEKELLDRYFSETGQDAWSSYTARQLGFI